jgi:hypothetical protein
VYRWKHAKSGSGTTRTPTRAYAAASKTMHIIAPQPWTRPSYAMIFRHPPRMNHAGRFASVRWLGLANPSGGSCHPSWHPPRNTERPNSLSTRWLFFSIKPAKTHQSGHTKGSVPFSKAQLRHSPSKQPTACSADAARKMHTYKL